LSTPPGGAELVSNAGSKRRSEAGAETGAPRKARAPRRKKSAAPKRAAEFLERLLPDTDEQSGTAAADRKTRLATAHKVGKAHVRATEVFDRIEEELDKDEQSAEQWEWEDRGRRRESDERSRERAEARADMRQEVWREERQRAMRHQDWLLVLTIVTTLAAISLAYLAVKHDQIEFIGAAGFSALLSGIEVYVMRWIQGSRDEVAAAGDATPVEPPPFKWSVLDLRREVEDERLSPRG
jgi:hypothetical protein